MSAEVTDRIKSVYCVMFGHEWDDTHGYRDAPNSGAVCQRCHRVFV